VSSPIEYADKLQGNLLIAHGMVDDNVFYQDSVRMAQRLIELKKDNWDLASYPLERHGFVQPESWYDEYRRIYQLFDRTLKTDTGN
jgi:dipeptidyl aminopeptidase/acylaminoacyl peptidase